MEPQETPADNLAEPISNLSDYPEQAYQPDTGADLDAEISAADADRAVPFSDELVHWAASEQVEHDRGRIWYVLVVCAALAFVALDIFWFKSYTFTALVLVMTATLFIYIKRPPQEQKYTLSGRQGLYIGEKLYHLSEFKSFGLVKDDKKDDSYSIALVPVKRFALSVSLYFPEEVGEQIVDILGQRLPMEEFKPDAVDLLVRKLRL